MSDDNKFSRRGILSLFGAAPVALVAGCTEEEKPLSPAVVACPPPAQTTSLIYAFCTTASPDIQYVGKK